ncbi:MAG TPA: DUF4282 domain-containing protein [Propionibacterium sp.]|nr:DUF4282 domain-containing protein [Propionibacterium sp.]
MANENTPDEPRQPESFPSPEPWATTPRHRITPPPEGGEPSPFARPAENPWDAPEPTQAEPTQVQPPPADPTPVEPPAERENPYAASAWGNEPTSQLPPYPGTMPPPPPPASPYPTQAPPSGASWTPPPATPGSAPDSPFGRVSAYNPANWRRDANPFSALFDFSFTKFATPGLVKIVYILQVVAAVGTWLIWVLGAFAADSFGGGFGTGLVALLFGWIPVLLSIAFTRFVLEAIVALIRIHDRVAEIADRTQGPSAT